MKQPPNSICILRLSAIGDVTHMIPVVRTLQKHWPNTKLTWIIGKNEANLVKDFPNIEFVIFDKSKAFSSYLSIYKSMKRRVFDVLICAQVSLRANFLSSLINANLKLGYDKARAKDLHTLFVDESIKATPKQHVLDSFFSFIEYLGLRERELTWDYLIPDDAHQFAEQYIDNNRFNLIISPCSSHPQRNWKSEHYAAVADFAVNTLNAQVILCGGPSELEKKYGREIETSINTKVTNLIGKDTLKKFLAILSPKRSGPYLSQQWCIDKYDEAAKK